MYLVMFFGLFTKSSVLSNLWSYFGTIFENKNQNQRTIHADNKALKYLPDFWGYLALEIILQLDWNSDLNDVYLGLVTKVWMNIFS